MKYSTFDNDCGIIDIGTELTTFENGFKTCDKAAETKDELIKDRNLLKDDDGIGGECSIPSSVLSLAKNIIGGGMLALPGGMAAGSGTGFLSAVFLVVIMCAMSSYSFYLVGPKHPWIVDAAISFICFGGCIMYSCFLGDLFSSLSASVLTLPSIFESRTAVIVGMTCTILLPLCLLKNLSAFRYSSSIGLCAALYTAVFIVFRYMDGSYSTASSFEYAGMYLNNEAAVTSRTYFSCCFGSVILLNICSTSYSAHPNAVKFYVELQNTSPKRFSIVVISAYVFSAVVYLTVMVFGYATFGQATLPIILNNYSETDRLAIVGRLATGISMLGGQPLIFAGVSDSTLSSLVSFKLAPSDPSKLASFRVAVNVIILTAVTVIAVLNPNVEIVVSLFGSLLCAGFMFSLPPLIYLCISNRMQGHEVISHSCIYVFFLRILFASGVVLTIVGTVLTLTGTKG